MVQYTSPYSLPLIDLLDKIAGGAGDNLREDVNALATATNAAMTGLAGKLWNRGNVPNGADLNDYYGTAYVGVYGVPLQSNVDSLTNAPAGAKPGSFFVLPVGSTASTHIWMEYVAPGRMFVSAVASSGRGVPWRDLTASDDDGNFMSSGFANFDAITKTSRYSLWNGTQATDSGAPVGKVGEVDTYVFGNAGIQTFTTTDALAGSQVFVRGKGSTGWGKFKEVTNQPAAAGASTRAGFKNAYLALNQPATSGTEAIAAASVRYPLLTGVGSKRARLHIRNWNWATGATFGPAAFTGAWMGVRSGSREFAGAPQQVLPAFNLPAGGGEYVSPWFNYDLTADVAHLISVGFTTAGGQVNQSSRGICYRTTNPADAPAVGYTAAGAGVFNTSPFDVWLEMEVPASTPIIAGFGDSNTVGTGVSSVVYDSWLNVYARAARAIPYFAAIHGSNTDTWDDPTGPMWNRLAGVASPDAVINFLGQNDLGDGVTLATLQANFNTILPILRDKLAADVYVATITPGNAKSADVNAVRKSYNAWLKTLPGGVKDAFDFSAAVSDDDATIRAADNADGLHFVTSGHTKIAATLTARPVTPDQLATKPDLTASAAAGIADTDGKLAAVAKGTDLASSHLDTIKTPGTYYKTSNTNATAAYGYPPGGQAGIVEVKNWGSNTTAGNLIQIHYPWAADYFFVRHCYQGNWEAEWAEFNTIRWSQAAGRSATSRNPLSGNQQLIYGDTGWRDITALVPAGITANNLRIRRLDNVVFVSFQTCSSQTAGNVTIVDMPAGFAADAVSLRTGLVADRLATSIRHVSPYLGALRILDMEVGKSYEGGFSFTTNDPWPASLPGSTVSGGLPA